MNKYMHTIDGKPAFFHGGQICFVRQGVAMSELLVPTLRQIRREQQAAIAYRREKGWRVFGYDYIRVRVDN